MGPLLYDPRGRRRRSFLTYPHTDGHLCIIDDGFAADGVTPFDWKQVPTVAAERPVTLTHVVNNTRGLAGLYPVARLQRHFVWQSPGTTVPHPLCAGGNEVATAFDLGHPKAQLRLSAEPDESTAETLTGNAIGFDTFVIQGNGDAQQWLCKQFEWMNFSENDNEDEEITPKYNLFEILKMRCKFWGMDMSESGAHAVSHLLRRSTRPKL